VRAPRLSVADFAECPDLALGKEKVRRVPDLGTRHTKLLPSALTGHSAKWPLPSAPTGHSAKWTF